MNNLHWDWYLLESWPGMMATAQVEVVIADVEFYLPQTWDRRKVDGRPVPVPAPRLPGNYAFVRLANDQDGPGYLDGQVSALLQLRGVHRICAGASRRYGLVRPGEITALKQIEAEEYRAACSGRSRDRKTRFKPGAAVRIIRHATFEGVIAEFVYGVRGEACITLENGILLHIPECDLAEVEALSGRRRA